MVTTILNQTDRLRQLADLEHPGNAKTPVSALFPFIGQQMTVGRPGVRLPQPRRRPRGATALRLCDQVKANACPSAGRQQFVRILTTWHGFGAPGETAET